MSISITNSISSLSSLNVDSAVATIDNLLSDTVSGCSKPFAVRLVRNSLGAVDGLKDAFLSELGDHMYMQRRNEYNALYGRNTETVVKTTGVDALKALRSLLSQYNATGIKCDYCDHQLTVLAEYIVFGK